MASLQLISWYPTERLSTVDRKMALCAQQFENRLVLILLDFCDKWFSFEEFMRIASFLDIVDITGLDGNGGSAIALRNHQW